MAIYIASTEIHSTSGVSSPVTLKIRVTAHALLREIDILEGKNAQASLRPWQILDLLAQIFPKYVHSHEEHFEVNFMSPYLTVTHKSNGGNKYYRLDKNVACIWPLTIYPAHLRAMIYWWRCNRDQYDTSIWEWGTWKNEA